MTEARILFGPIAGDLGRRFCVRFEGKGAWKRAFFTGELVIVRLSAVYFALVALPSSTFVQGQVHELIRVEKKFAKILTQHWRAEVVSEVGFPQ
jgi:hypothetical protein